MLRNIVSVIDGAAGSCGKAKVVGEIATDKRLNIGASITNCMPNAGHTFVDETGKSTVFRNIPVSTMNPNIDLFIGPGSAIDMEVFKSEYEKIKPYLNGRKIYVHELVPLIESRHKEFERKNIKSGSTLKGCGAVNSEKIMRYPFLGFFKGYENAIVLSNDDWLDKLYEHIENPNEYILLEGSQGCDLCLNHSGNYPYVTSRNISTTQMLADSGISAERLLQTIMVIRPFPIRISNITQNGEIIYTGNYGAGEELTWSQINLASIYGGYPVGEILYPSHLSPKLVKKWMGRIPDYYLKQLFGENYKSQDPEEVTLLQALELERLYYKAKNISEYETKILDLGMFDSDFPPNTIIDQSEQTTVTKMERRIFDLDIKKLKNNCRINTPSSLYLNFFQHLIYELAHQTGNYDDFYIQKHLRVYLDWLEDETNTEISTLGTGAKNGERILKRQLVKEIIK